MRVVRGVRVICVAGVLRVLRVLCVLRGLRVWCVRDLSVCCGMSRDDGGLKEHWPSIMDFPNPVA